MPGMLTRIKVIYPVWLAIKWLAITAVLSRSRGCGDDDGRAVQMPPLSNGWITITSQPVDVMTSTDCAVLCKSFTLVRAT